MSSKLIICVLVLWKCASCIVAEGDLNETFQKCVSLNDSYYCSQYKLMKFLKKQKTEPAATNTGIQTLDNIYINSQDYFSKLFKFIRNVLYSVLTKEDSDPMAKNGNKANLEELSPRKASLRGKQYYILYDYFSPLLLSTSSWCFWLYHFSNISSFDYR